MIVNSVGYRLQIETALSSPYTMHLPIYVPLGFDAEHAHHSLQIGPCSLADFLEIQ